MNKLYLKKLQKAFTIIEVLISVLIISFAIIFVLKLHTDNEKQIIYISERNKLSLQDSLYLTRDILNHHKDNKSAYDILEKEFKIKKLESREILKNQTRDIFIPEEIKIIPPPEQPGPVAIVNEVLIKDKYSSIFYHFKLESF
ncbi:MAG: prepilin-type N-terminal cleavage/methylation domain-containing protein [Sulfurovum sp.]